jgi:ATP-dependent Lon protease
MLHDHFALNAMGDGRVAWSPLLLVGPAGIGKTEAARWLAERLALPFRVFDMSAQSGSPLAGSEAFWSNSEPGLLFELLAYQPKANPVVVLDELDKTEQVRQYDPLAALYTLLEPAAHGPSRTSLSVISPSMPATSTGSRRQTA